MRTKEQLIDENAIGISAGEVCLEYPKALSILDEYAKEQAIAFSEWNCKNLWSTHNGMWYPYQDEDNPITGEQLYQLWLESQSIQQ